MCFKNLFLLSVLILGFFQAVYGQAKIVNGEPTTIADCPSCVYLADKSGKLLCGATMIHKQFCTSAATCTKPHTAAQLDVHGAKTYQRETGEVIPVHKMIYSSNFDQETYNFDIALVRLSKPFTSALVVPAVRCTSPPQVYDVMTQYGWGQISENGLNSNVLRKTNLGAMKKEDCLTYIAPLTGTQYCTINSNSGGCKNDYGSGTYNDKGEYCGHLSWTYGCGRDYPNLHCSAIAVANFIDTGISRNL
ncbi:trypsin-like [Teleopsis dalmanni]|uniref:trypsin-like n=1 Tax=Teleopsis dalmanni TaxID=139649 RepID=UPI0018CFA6BB|nr:trypsin-like [Teleopsis dalmanni]XP_037950115.1 trypsin-like [Teleopsis dalmanni]